MQNLLFRKLSCYKSLEVTFSYFLIVIISSGIFFIRDDWPFGFDGSYFVAIGVLLFAALFLFRFSVSIKVPKLGLYSGIYTFWICISLTTVLVFSIIYETPSLSVFFGREYLLIFMIFFSGYLAVKYLKFSPLELFTISSIWVLIATIAMMDSLLTGDAVRRIKALASVNYMSASFGAFFIFSLGSLILEKNHSRIKKIYLLSVLFFSLIGFLLSGSRTVIFGVIIVLTLWLFVYLLKRLSKSQFSRSEIYKVSTSIILSIFFIVTLAWILRDVNIAGLLRRFDYVSLIQAGEQRILSLAIASLPDTFKSSIFGNPFLYPLFQAGNIHPHNILVSIWRFTGLFPFLLFLIFMGLIFFYRIYLTKNNLSKKKRVELFIVVSSFSIIFIYTMFSGHFTRSWHLYWTVGLLSAYLEGIKSEEKYFEGRS